MRTSTSRTLYLSGFTVIAVVVLLALPGIALAQSPATGLISVNSPGTGSGNGAALNNALSFSADGRYVAFVSEASDLVLNDANNTSDMFVRDRQTGQTILVSANATGTGTGNQSSRAPAITPDGRYVAFISASSNLVTDDAAVSIHEDVYVRDLQTGTTTLVSRNFAGTARGNGLSGGNAPLKISADGRLVLFTSWATDLVASTTTDTNGQTDVFVRDLQTRTTTLVSVNQNGTGTGNNVSDAAVITPNGRFVVFLSQARDLISLNSGFPRQVFMRDLQTGVTSLVSVNRFGTSGGNRDTDSRRGFDMTVSPDGRFVAFATDANDLVVNDTNNAQDIFVRDMQSGITQLVSIAATGNASGNAPSGQLAMTPDGHYVAFLSASDNLVANSGDNNLQHDVFVRDLHANTTALISINRVGAAGGNGNTNTSLFLSLLRPAVSDDGRYVSFASSASDLTSANDTNGGNPLNSQADVFVRDRQVGTTTPVSVNYSGTDTGQGTSGYAAIAHDGKTIFYFSGASDLVSYDTNGGIQDVFVFVNVQEPGQVRFKAATTVSGENAGAVNVVVNLASPATVPVSINFNSVDGTAMAGADYFSAAGTLTFAPGETEKTFSVSLIDDALDETTETVILRLSSANNGSVIGEPNIFLLSLTDDDPTPTLKIGDSITAEGNTGTTNAIFNVSLSAPSGRTISVQVGTQSSTASAGVDYLAVSGQLIFNPGQTSRQIAVPIKGDTEVEPDETFFLNLSNPTGATIADVQGTGTITNDDAATQFNISGSVKDPSTGGVGGVLITVYLEQVGTTLSTQTDANGNYAFTGLPLGQNRVTVTPSKGGLNFSPQSSGLVSTSSLGGNNTINFVAGTPYYANLTGAQVVPPTNSNGLGFGLLTLSLDETKASVDLNFGALSGSQTQAHIHSSNGPGVSGPVLFTLPRGLISNLVITLTPSQVQLLKAGQLYFDIHTNLFANGELRGQIMPLPLQTLQFSAATYSVSENGGSASVTVTRGGDTSGTATVDYRTVDTDTFMVGCADTVGNQGGAFARCDFSTIIGKLSFAAGETSKTITVPIINDGHVEGAETFQLHLSNATGGATLGALNVATITITDNDAAGTANPIVTLSPADYSFFVRQQYLDFLSREPETGEPWTAVMNRCANVNTGPAVTTDCDRIAVSAAFFGSPEFQLKGFYVFRFYKLAFNRLPQYTEIVSDMSFVAGATEQEVYARKAQLATAFVARSEFVTAYGGLNNADYVSALLARYGLASVTTPDPATPDGVTKITLSGTALRNALDAGAVTRAQVFRAIADSDEVSQREFNPAFVAVQYYGYLRRTPDDNGYQAWLRVINQDANNVRIMINGFMNSTEYRLRFGQP